MRALRRLQVTPESKRSAVVFLLAASLVATLPFASLGPTGSGMETTPGTDASAQHMAQEGADVLPSDVAAAAGALPVHFVATGATGPMDPLYLATTPQDTVLVERDGLRFVPHDAPAHSVLVRFAGDGVPQVAAEGPHAATVHYFLGNDPSAWRTGVKTYDAVRYAGIHDGIDVVVHVDGDRVRFDHVVAPGADPDRVRLEFPGTEALALEADGRLRITVGGHDHHLDAPVLYQDTPDGRISVAGGFRLHADGSVGYWVGEHDAGHALVIDPILRYSSFLGNAGVDYGYDLDVYAPPGSPMERHVYVAGSTTQLNFPLGFPAGGQYTHDGGEGITSTVSYVAKMSYDLQARQLTPLWYAFLGGTAYPSGGVVSGGSAIDIAYGVAADPAGHVYLTGSTTSRYFPVVNPIIDVTDNGGVFSGAAHSSGGGLALADAFVAQIHRDGDELLFSSYLGPIPPTIGRGIAALPDGTVAVVGETQWNYIYPNQFPTKDAHQPLHGNVGDTVSRYDAFLARIDTSSTPASFVFSTLIGGPGNEYGNAVAVDADGIYVGGNVALDANGFPASTGAFQTTGTGTVGFVARYTLAGTQVYATLLGGTSTDVVHGVAPAGGGAAWAVGETFSANFPVCPTQCATGSPAPIQGTSGGGYDAFVTRVNPAGSALTFSTYLGGTGGDYAHGAFREPGADSVLVVGRTLSTNFPTASPTSPTQPGGTSGFVARIDPTQTTPLRYSSYLGGSGTQWSTAVAADNAGNIYATGYTQAGTFPMLSAVQPVHGGSTYDAFLTILGKKPPTAVIQATAPGTPPQTSPLAAPFEAFTNDPVSLDGSPSEEGDLPIATYSWELRDAQGTLLQTATGAVPSFSPLAHSTIGTLREVCLTVTDTDTSPVVPADGTDTVCIDVEWVNRPPIAEFAFDGPDVPMSRPIPFTDLSTDLDGTVVAWHWSFGDGGSSTSQHPIHFYGNLGSYTVTLTVTDDLGATGVRSYPVTVGHGPTAEFTHPAGPFTESVHVPFTDGSFSGARPIEEWTWDLGDGTIVVHTGSPGTFAHAYTAAGTYTVRLTVDDGVLKDTRERTLQVGPAVPSGVPDQYFAVQNTPLVRNAAQGILANDGHPASLPIFVASHTDPVVGNLIMASDGSFTYTPPFDYIGPADFTYFVSDGTNVVGPVPVSLQVSPFAPPEASFQVRVDGRTVRLTDTTQPGDHPIASWKWEPGDGAVLQDQHPVHVYGEGGFYTVRLTVLDTYGFTAHAERVLYVFAPTGEPLIGQEAPRVHVLRDRIQAMPGATVLLEAQAIASGQGTAHLRWTQVDGPPVRLLGADTGAASFVAPTDPARLVFEVHAYAGGIASEPVQVEVSVASTNRAPQVHVQAPVRTVSADAPVILDAVAHDPDGDPLRYHWALLSGPAVDFAGADGPVLTFDAPATQSVLRFRVTVEDPGGLKGSAEAVVNVVQDAGSLVARFDTDRSQIHSGTVRFLDRSTAPPGSTYTWNLDDGSPPRHQKDLVHTYEEPGSYQAVLQVRAPDGSMARFERTVVVPPFTDPVPPGAQAVPLEGAGGQAAQPDEAPDAGARAVPHPALPLLVLALLASLLPPRRPRRQQ